MVELQKSIIGMSIMINYDERIIIIEGISGSGKDTLQKKLTDEYSEKGFIVYSFKEEELLYSWKHLWVENLDIIRIKYWHLLLSHFEELLEDEKTIIILNRFHISFKVFAKFDDEIKKEYFSLVKRLETFPIKIMILNVDEEEIEKRSAHVERKETIFQIHRKKRLEKAKVQTFKELYEKEQKEYVRIAEKQGLPYDIINSYNVK